MSIKVPQMRAVLGLGPDTPDDAEVVQLYLEYLDGAPEPEEPVTLAEARAELRMTADDDTSQDPLIQGLIYAAREMVEKFSGTTLLGKLPADVPAPLKLAILKLVAHWFDGPDAAEPPVLIATLCRPYRRLTA